MKFLLDNYKALPRAIADNISFATSATASRRVSHVPAPNHPVPDDFFGICVASNKSESCDDFVVGRLRELGLRHVRLDIMELHEREFHYRLLEKLLDEGFKVALHIVQLPQRSALTGAKQIDKTWHDFVSGIVEKYGERLELVEIGSTVNRRKWSGYSIPSFLNAWKTAYPVMREANALIGGPNVTDFEPFYNAAILGQFRRMDLLPDIHTNNLFVERATEPEAWDPKILGRILAPLIRFNTIKKAWVLKRLSTWAGVERTFSMHVSWSLRRIGRLLHDQEKHQADYVSRYCCLAAASGALDRMYWGPLIGQREGLIDDGTAEFPDLPHVTFYGRANGSVETYRERAAFAAFKTTISMLSGATYAGPRSPSPALEVHEFRRDNELLHVVWARNSRQAPARLCYEADDLETALAFTNKGDSLDAVPEMFSETPVYLKWHDRNAVTVLESAAIVADVRFAAFDDRTFGMVKDGRWRGACVKTMPGPDNDFSWLHPDAVAAARSEVLRDSRNTIWTIPFLFDRDHEAVVKYFKPLRVTRRILDIFKPGKARRSWNNTNELLRRGIDTPPPLAFFEDTSNPLAGEGFFVCERFSQSRSARDAFTAFSKGAGAFDDIAKHDMFRKVAEFVLNMHEKGVFFRDLSAGNLLFRRGAGGDLEFSLIDTARCRFYRRPLSMYRRLCDLVRICHPLDQASRTTFMRIYCETAGKSMMGYHWLLFGYYDWKHRSKRVVRKVFPKRS